MEQHCCMVCGKTFDTGNILLDTRIVNGKLPQTFDRHTVTGWGLCEGHEKLHKDGFVALVAIDESKSRDERGQVTPRSAYRTGTVAHVRRTVAKEIFNVPPEEIDLPMVFCDAAVIDKLKAMQVES